MYYLLETTDNLVLSIPNVGNRGIRIASSGDPVKKNEESSESSPNASRGVKGKAPAIGESIKMVTHQLLEKPSNKTEPVVIDTRVPPKLKTQIAQKHKIKTRNEDETELENSHAGIAVPMNMDDVESESVETGNESSTSYEGISTWILVSNPTNKESSSTEPTKTLDKKQKLTKNKNKRPQGKLPSIKRPIIGSTNKSDLVAGGSAINENVYNKIKDTVLTNVQKNKNSVRTTTSTTPLTSSSEMQTTKKVTDGTKSTSTTVTKSTTKLNKKTNKNKQKVSSVPVVHESAMLPMEAKEQEIELEISTPATTTKKPKRSSNKKKTKTKKRKTSKPKPEATTAVTTELKHANKTKSTKQQKKPSSLTGPFTTQIYNYFSREVMPSVGVGVIGLASLLGIAGYFLYPFTGTPVRRTFEVDKKDDIYKHNAEEYANDGNGQPEEEMLGTVLAGMPAHTKQKYNPYIAQTTHVNRYTIKKDQDIRYRPVTNKYDTKYNVHYQQKTGIAHGAVYAEPVNYNNYHQYESRHAYTTERSSSYAPYPAVEPIYTASQVGSSSFANDSPGAVVYGVKPSQDSDFKPVYPYEAQYHSETTNNPATYSPTSMYLGSNDDGESDNNKFSDESSNNSGIIDNKFVVGNVPKEFTDSVTPAVVPEHGPRKLRKRRNIRKKRSVVGSIEDILKAARENKENDIFLSNEIDGGFESAYKMSPSKLEGNKDMYTIDPVFEDDQKLTKVESLDNDKTEMVESVSTLPIENKDGKTEISNDVEETTKTFKVYEVFNTNEATIKSSSLIEDEKSETTTQIKNINTETTTEIKSETTSTMPPSPSIFLETTSIKSTDGPEIFTYPPASSSGYGIFDFIKRLVEFKYRLGLSILQTTSDSLNRYLRSLDNSGKKSSKSL